MYEVDAQSPGDREQDGDDDVHRAVGVDEAAGYEQDDIDNEQEQELAVAADAYEGRARVGGDAGEGQGVGEEARGADYEHDDCGLADGVLEEGPEVAGLELLRGEADDYAVYRGDGRGLGRGEEAAVDAAEDDDGHQQARNGAHEGVPALTAAGLGQGDELAPAVGEHHGEDEEAAHEYAGDDAGGEELADALAGDGAVDDEGDARRDDYAYRAGGGDQGGGVVLTISNVGHCGDEYHAESGDGGRAGAGDGGEEAGDYNGDQRHAAAAVADEGAGEVDELGGYAGLVHDVAAEDEEGDGQQHELARGRVEVGGDGQEGQALVEDDGEARDAEREGYGHIHEQEQEEYAEEYEGGHQAISSFP